MEVVEELLQFRERHQSRDELTIRLYNAGREEESEGITFFSLRYSISLLGLTLCKSFCILLKELSL